MKKLQLLLAVALMAGVACWPFDDAQPLAEMTVRAQSGSVVLLRAGEAIEVTDDTAVQPGDLIRTLDGGVASLRLEGDRQATLTSPSLGRAELAVVATDVLESRTGSLLAKTEDPMKVRFGDVIAQSSAGTFRVDQRAGAARVGTFEGAARLTAPGEATVAVPRLHEAPASAGDVRDERPYRLDPSDPFDKTELAPIVELESRLQQLTAGFTPQLGNQRPTLAYFQVLADGTNVSPIRPYLGRQPAELLTAFTIAIHTDKPFGDAIEEAFDYRAQGGQWSVIAGIMRSRPQLVLADLSDMLVATGAVDGGEGDAAEFSVAAAEAADEGTTISDGGDPGDTGGSGSGGGTGGGSGGGTGGGGGSGGGGGGGGGGDDEEPPDCQSGIECDIQELIGDDPSPSPSSDPDRTALGL
ncbi:MAG: hypothetical protein M3161_01670 [Actinomycetota bacterium]|nr:hypothetical protein [Actinomycetota bacterium]